jgi:hypothetical protein
MKASAILVAVALLSGCWWEQKEESYASFAAAEDAGAMKRGWIPEWLPRNSSDLKEKHDLDTNSSILRFSFVAAGKWTPSIACKQIPSAQTRSPSVKASWWPSDVPASALVTPRHSLFQCGQEFLALDATRSEGYFWRP